jgi:hypothetical protein
MVARGRIKLLVARLVFLVYDHQTEAIKRKKYGGANAHDKRKSTTQHSIPNLHPLVVRIARVVDANAGAKYLL